MRAAIYTRQSLDRAGKQLGVTRQQKECQALADQLGWQVVEVYSDNDKSAMSGKIRPGFEAMLKAMEAGEVDALICWHSDRLYRSLTDLVRLFEAGAGIEIRTVNAGALDLSTASGKMLATMLGGVSSFESEHKAERQRAAAKQKAERGLPQWRKAFGYLPGINGPELDPVTAPMVRQAYAAILAGSSLGDIARMFNDAGAYGLNGKPWTQSTISLFLRKERNAGLRTYNGEVVGKGNWPAIVDENTWRAVQSVLDAPGRAPGPKSVRRHLLTGLMICGKCGDHLSGRWTTSKQIAYQCKSCSGVSIRAEHAEPLIYSIVSARLTKRDAMDLLRKEIHDTAEAEALRVEAETLLTELDNLAVERAEGLLTARQVKISTDIINDKLAAIEHRQQDQERLRVFNGLPLGTPQVVGAVRQLSPDRFRAVVGVLMTITVAPVGKGRPTFQPERVQVTWR